MQDDATSCGFWVVWFDFACAMGISVPQSIAGRTLSDVKKMLGLFYINHVNGEHGLQEKVLRDAFASLHPPVSLPQDAIVPKDGIVHTIHLLYCLPSLIDPYFSYQVAMNM